MKRHAGIIEGNRRVETSGRADSATRSDNVLATDTAETIGSILDDKEFILTKTEYKDVTYTLLHSSFNSPYLDP